MCHHSANKSLFYWRFDKKMNLSQLIRGKWGHPNYGNLYSLYMHTCTSHIPVQWMKRQSLVDFSNQSDVVICRRHNIKLERDQKLPVRLPIINLYLFFLGTCKMRNEIETKRNEIYRNETKRGKFRFDLFRFVSHFTGIPIKMRYFSDVSLILNQTDIIFTSFLHFTLFSVKVKTE